MWFTSIVVRPPHHAYFQPLVCQSTPSLLHRSYAAQSLDSIEFGSWFRVEIQNKVSFGSSPTFSLSSLSPQLPCLASDYHPYVWPPPLLISSILKNPRVGIFFQLFSLVFASLLHTIFRSFQNLLPPRIWKVDAFKFSSIFGVRRICFFMKETRSNQHISLSVPLLHWFKCVMVELLQHPVHSFFHYQNSYHILVASWMFWHVFFRERESGSSKWDW